jgi:small-conductance mechanosensitive channel
MTFSLLNNPLDIWAAAIGVAVAATAAMYLARAFLLRRIERMQGRTETRLDDLLATMLGSTYLLFIVAVAFYLGSLLLDLPPKRQLLISRVAVSALLVQLAVWGDTGIRFWRTQLRRRVAANDPAGITSASAVCFVLRVALWTVILLMILENLGVNITTLITSLGIGGIAVALAVQNILGDLFASLSIMLDKPFQVGDFIIVGEVLGSVEYIGLKTTRVRGLGGEQIILSNGDLLKSRIHNHRRMESRRVAFVIRVTYETTEQQLRAIPQMVRAIVSAQEMANFERAHFFAFGEWSLDFEVVYHVGTPDYNVHMDLQQTILLALVRQFEREGIEFAYPTHRLQMVSPSQPSGAKRPADRSA